VLLALQLIAFLGLVPDARSALRRPDRASPCSEATYT